MSDWLGHDRATAAAERILDAAAALFARDGAAVSMSAVAAAAGCSRATLYRYFSSRDELRLAFVDREARRIGAAVAAGVDPSLDGRERLVDAVVAAMAEVRADPLLMAWFGEGHAGSTAGIARSSEVIDAMATGFLAPWAEDGPVDDEVRHRARWLVRCIVSLLVQPEADAAAERAVVARFVVPVVAAAGGDPDLLVAPPSHG